MDVAVDILFWIHLLSLGLAGVATFGIPFVGSKLPGAPAESRPVLFKIMHQMSTVGRAALVLLLITGPLIFWLRYGWVAPNAWFWVKMVLILLLIAIMVGAGLNARRTEQGDTAAARRAPQIGTAAIITFALVILAAVLAFD